MDRFDRKKTEIYKKMKASYITLTENCTYFNITKKELSKCKIEKLRSENLIETSKNRLRTTDRGKLLTNYIIKELLC